MSEDELRECATVGRAEGAQLRLCERFFFVVFSFLRLKPSHKTNSSDPSDVTDQLYYHIFHVPIAYHTTGTRFH